MQTKLLFVTLAFLIIRGQSKAIKDSFDDSSKPSNGSSLTQGSLRASTGELDTSSGGSSGAISSALLIGSSVFHGRSGEPSITTKNNLVDGYEGESFITSSRGSTSDSASLSVTEQSSESDDGSLIAASGGSNSNSSSLSITRKSGVVDESFNSSSNGSKNHSSSLSIAKDSNESVSESYITSSDRSKNYSSSPSPVIKGSGGSFISSLGSVEEYLKGALKRTSRSKSNYGAPGISSNLGGTASGVNRLSNTFTSSTSSDSSISSSNKFRGLSGVISDIAPKKHDSSSSFGFSSRKIGSPFDNFGSSTTLSPSSSGYSTTLGSFPSPALYETPTISFGGSSGSFGGFGSFGGSLESFKSSSSLIGGSTRSPLGSSGPAGGSSGSYESSSGSFGVSSRPFLGGGAKGPLVPQVPIISYEGQGPIDGVYSFSFETGDGIRRLEQGAPREGTWDVLQQGEWSFTFPDGTPAQFNFQADENGFQVQSDLLPVGPPLPPHALAQIEIARQQDEAAKYAQS